MTNAPSTKNQTIRMHGPSRLFSLASITPGGMPFSRASLMADILTAPPSRWLSSERQPSRPLAGSAIHSATERSLVSTRRFLPSSPLSEPAYNHGKYLFVRVEGALLSSLYEGIEVLHPQSGGFGIRVLQWNSAISVAPAGNALCRYSSILPLGQSYLRSAPGCS